MVPLPYEKRSINRSKRSILLFARVPEKGRVKTRLTKKLSPETVLRLYKFFVEDILESIRERGYDTTVCYHPPEGSSKMMAWLEYAVDLEPQTGSNLGERMQQAFLQVFSRGVDRAVLIGSDIPDLDIRIVDKAFSALVKNDVVIGPAVDGGYYLIGFRAKSFNKHIFTDVPWGTDYVFRKTIQMMDKERLSKRILPLWQDIDTFEDLVAFFQRCKKKELFHLKSMQYIAKNLFPQS
jgi:rSAM/selenodomain-associated transferase 1